MNDLEKYVDFLFEGQNGYVYSPIKKDSWDSVYFAWPSERTQLLDHIKVNGSEHDVYVAPSIFSKKEGTRESFKSSTTVWVEFDGKDVIDFKSLPEPDVIIQTSSSTHVHCYWKTEPITNKDVLEDVNRRLTYYLQADSSGTEANQLLRPPSSTNVKRGGLPVLLAHFSKEISHTDLSDFDIAPRIDKKIVSITEATFLDSEKLLRELPLLKSLRHKIEKESVLEGQRSSFMYKIAHELAEIGCNHSQIATLINFVNDRIGKFPDSRSDKLIRISEIASIAIHSVGIEQEISLYSPKDVLEHTDDLEWIYDKWLHDQGLMLVTGAPGVGKTQFCLQLMYAFSVGQEFLKSTLTKKKVLFMSLEMDVRELKYLLRIQRPDFNLENEWSKNSAFMDEPGSLLQYEELFESFGPGVVIMDSLFELADGDLTNNAELIQLTRWLKRMRKKYGFAVVMIAHNRKAGVGNKKPNKLDDIFGGVVLNKEIDTAVCLWQEENQNWIDVFPVKSRFSKKEDFQIERSDNLTFSIRETTKDSRDEQPDTSVKKVFGLDF